MKRLLLLTNFVFLSLLNSAQTNVYHPMPDSGALWSEYYYTNSSSGYYLNGLLGDTTVNSHAYHKFYIRNPVQGVWSDTLVSPNNSLLVGGIREDSSKRVFFYGLTTYNDIQQDSIYLLYDFSKSVGDTIFFHTPWPYAPYAWEYVVVNAIDSVQVGQQYRKRFDVGMDVWIEGVGSTYDVLSSIMQRPLCTCVHELICYNYRGEHEYKSPGFSGCYPYTGLNAEGYDPTEDLLVFPVPANEFVEMEMNSQSVYGIRIFDMRGSCVLSSVSMGRSHINCKDMEPGIYDLMITRQDRRINKKLVIVH